MTSLRNKGLSSLIKVALTEYMELTSRDMMSLAITHTVRINFRISFLNDLCVLIPFTCTYIHTCVTYWTYMYLCSAVVGVGAVQGVRGEGGERMKRGAAFV